jgi:hypothetical protein
LSQAGLASSEKPACDQLSGEPLGTTSSRTHTLWNSRIDEIRPFILRGLAGGDFKGF